MLINSKQIMGIVNDMFRMSLSRALSHPGLQLLGHATMKVRSGKVALGWSRKSLMPKLVIAYLDKMEVRREWMQMLSWEDSIPLLGSWRGLLYLG